MPTTFDGFRYQIEDGDENVWIRFKYNPILVERIKRLPQGTRRWDAEQKAWCVEFEWVYEAERLLKGEPRKSRPPPSLKSDDHHLEIVQSLTADHIELGVLPGVPWEIVESVHRRWAALIHPDLGGDPEMMKKKNIARDNLRKRYGKKE
jgi:hypothetical protein